MDPAAPRVVEDTIIAKLTAAFAPTHLTIANESGKHNVPRGSETHFNVAVVSDAFAGVGAVARHRLVHTALKAELAGGVHALSVSAKTTEEATGSGATKNVTPPCYGGPSGAGRLQLNADEAAKLAN
jgi:BolA protein